MNNKNMEKEYLTIRNINSIETNVLLSLKNAIREINNDTMGILDKSLTGIENKIYNELAKREKTKMKWVRFTGYWSGNNSNNANRRIGIFYRKMYLHDIEKMQKTFRHSFSDNTINTWFTEVVLAKGKEEGSYESQVDDFINKLNIIV